MATVAAMDFEANICQRFFRLAEGTYSKHALLLEWADDTWTRQRSNQLARSLVTDFWRDGSSYRGLLREPGGGTVGAASAGAAGQDRNTGRMAMQKTLAGQSTRRHPIGLAPVSQHVTETAINRTSEVAVRLFDRGAEAGWCNPCGQEHVPIHTEASVSRHSIHWIKCAGNMRSSGSIAPGKT